MLTPRERQVVALVARGSTNKAIAEELFISPATAARHVANIMTKLGFNTRAQIAAWAADRQIDLVSHARRRSEPGEAEDPRLGHADLTGQPAAVLWWALRTGRATQ